MKRKTLATHGRVGQRIRVLVDGKRDRVEVQYTTRSKQRAKRIFPNTKAGREQALNWADVFQRERARISDGTLTTITHRQLWAKFIDAPAFKDTRSATQASYVQRWGLWTAHFGLDSDCNLVKLADLDGFIMAMRETPTRKGTVRSINQVRQVVNAARTVYNWGQSRELLRKNVFVGYRWKQPRDARALEPDEYTPQEYAKLVGGVSPQDGTRWRLHVMLVLAGVHGSRANAVRHLQWVDVEQVVTWNRDFQKSGAAHEQPLTWEMLAALETARYWTGRIPGRAVSRMSAGQRAALEALRTSPWVLPGHGDTTQPWGYQAMWKSLVKLEGEVGITHKPYRALHGLRRGAAGTVADQTGDDRLGLEWIGDRDLKQAKSYLKKRKSRMERAATAAANGTNDDDQTLST